MCSYNENVDNWIVKLTFVGTTKSLTLIPTWTYLGVWTFKAQTTLNESLSIFVETPLLALNNVSTWCHESSTSPILFACFIND